MIFYAIENIKFINHKAYRNDAIVNSIIWCN